MFETYLENTNKGKTTILRFMHVLLDYRSFLFTFQILTTQNAVSPSMFTRGKHGTFLDDPIARADQETSQHQRGLPHAQERTLCLIIVVVSPESVLPDVPAIHTIEMIPKSMILPELESVMIKRTAYASNNRCYNVFV